MIKTKKKKFTFTDLADEDFGIIEKDNHISDAKSDDVNNEKIDFTLDDLKSNNVNVENEPKDSQPNVTATDKIKTDENIKNVIKENKKVFEVNYDDILEDHNQDANEVVNNFFEKKDPIKDLFKTESSFQDKSESEKSNKSYKNLKPRSTLKTYNEAVKIQENNKSNGSFQEEKIREFLNIREKLEVKTNIYLKSSIVIKLKELEERTNESRSSIINKLIEIALKNIEE